MFCGLICFSFDIYWDPLISKLRPYDIQSKEDIQARSQQWGRVGPGPPTEGRGPPTEVGPHFHKGAPRVQIPLDLS